MTAGDRAAFTAGVALVQLLGELDHARVGVMEEQLSFGSLGREGVAGRAAAAFRLAAAGADCCELQRLEDDRRGQAGVEPGVQVHERIYPSEGVGLDLRDRNAARVRRQGDPFKSRSPSRRPRAA
jgi:hypothetical protein